MQWLHRAHRAVGIPDDAIPALVDPGICFPQSLEEEYPPQENPERTRHPETSSAYSRKPLEKIKMEALPSPGSYVLQKNSVRIQIQQIDTVSRLT